MQLNKTPAFCGRFFAYGDLIAQVLDGVKNINIG
ncbi:MAG: hypothetical protein ACJA13_000679 [Paraglaciecola sp.]|jgi:hypothetical protein